MNFVFSRTSIPSTRVAMMQRYVDALRSMGAPVERLLVRAGIPPYLLDRPSAAVPLPAAFRFGELACLAAGTEHLGLYVGLLTTLDALGVYGRTLKSADTLHVYLLRGMSLYNMLVTGQRLWLSEHGDDLRLNIVTVGEPGIGQYQSHLSTLVVTIAKCREIAGPDWSPREVSLAYRPRETFPDVPIFGQSQVALGTGQTYCTIPRAFLGRCFPSPGTRASVRAPGFSAERPLPRTLDGLVAHQIEALLPDQAVQIDTIAETLTLSRRSLQRALAERGLTYSEVLAEVRMRKATEWLKSRERPIVEIAFDLGYTDASNFTRAFRRQIGVSPQAFRQMAART